ncbi:hypothetical protein B0G73_111179 [Paraburkholderia sp. BL25I1N1]|nr:hypothetical protein B0G73_111179 [Paraburkholderia sp. BL25I1N1]
MHKRMRLLHPHPQNDHKNLPLKFHRSERYKPPRCHGHAFDAQTRAHA